MRRALACSLLALSLSPAALSGQSECRLRAPGPVRELRLGLVCYGGVSLAVYMFGTTRELHHLLLASEALELDSHAATAERPITAAEPGAEGARLDGSVRPYYDLLLAKSCAEGVRTRVVVDVISGTSAGGINGAVLAKAIATNRPIEPLRDLWFEHADIRRLAAWRPWWLSAPWRVLVRRKPALTGDGWLRQLHGALAGMDAAAPLGPGDDLLPDGARLDLLVTGTDFYGSPRVVEIGDPPSSRERTHAHVFRFQHPPAAGGAVASLAGRDANAALAFAARASASFPVAFPPVTVDDLLDLLPAGEKPDRERLARWLFPDQLADGAPDVAGDLFMIDGGVLDNYPLGLAFQRAASPGDVPAQRLFLFLEPDPAVLSDEAAPGLPNSWRTGWNALARIPGVEPVAEDLREVARTNERIDRVLDIIAQDEAVARREQRTGEQTLAPAEKGAVETRQVGVDAPTVATQIETVVRRRGGYERYDLGGDGLDLTTVAALRDEIERDAASAQPIVEEGYVRLRVHSVLDQLARNLATDVCALPTEYRGPRETLARAVVMTWAREARLIGREVSPAERARFLAAWDLGYLRRNLRFVLQWIGDQYPPAVAGEEPAAGASGRYGLAPEQIQRAHATVRAEIDALSAALRGDTLRQQVDPAVLAGLHDAFCGELDPDELPASAAMRLVREHSGVLQRFVGSLEPRLLETQQGIRARLYRAFEAQTAGWNNPEARQAVLARYLGFPYWDRLAYPYTAFSGTGDLARATIARLGPKDALALDDRGAAKLAGQKLGHFGAFLDAAGRQRDYVWGRLDGAERLSGLLGSPAATAFYRAILDDEAGSGAVAPEVLRQVKSCVDAPQGGACRAIRP